MGTNAELAQLPRNCSDLSKFGHKLNGIYPVRGSDVNTNKIALIFCQFNPPSASGKGFTSFLIITDMVIPEKKLGFVDIKSMPNRVAFFAHRDYPIRSGSPSIDFPLSKLNEGGALNLTSGVFTPPVNGTYAFHFRALAKKGGAGEVGVQLYHNDYMVTSSWFDGLSEHGQLGLSAALKLTTGDSVKLQQFGSGYIQDNGGYSTTFSGWLLEEYSNF